MVRERKPREPYKEYELKDNEYQVVPTTDCGQYLFERIRREYLKIDELIKQADEGNLKNSGFLVKPQLLDTVICCGPDDDYTWASSIVLKTSSKSFNNSVFAKSTDNAPFTCIKLQPGMGNYFKNIFRFMHTGILSVTEDDFLETYQAATAMSAHKLVLEMNAKAKDFGYKWPKKEGDDEKSDEAEDISLTTIDRDNFLKAVKSMNKLQVLKDISETGKVYANLIAKKQWKKGVKPELRKSKKEVGKEEKVLKQEKKSVKQRLGKRKADNNTAPVKRHRQEPIQQNNAYYGGVPLQVLERKWNIFYQNFSICLKFFV